MRDGIYWVTPKDRYLPVIFKKNTIKNANDAISSRIYGKSKGEEFFEYGFFADFHQGLFSRDCVSLPEFEAEFDVIAEILPPQACT